MYSVYVRNFYKNEYVFRVENISTGDFESTCNTYIDLDGKNFCISYDGDGEVILHVKKDSTVFSVSDHASHPEPIINFPVKNAWLHTIRLWEERT